VFSLGIDFGTSGVRAVVLDKEQNIISQAQSLLKKSTEFKNKNQIVIGYSQNPLEWWKCFEQVIFNITDNLCQQQLRSADISHLAIDGTSASVLLADADGNPVTDALMYNDQRALLQAKKIHQFAPEHCAADNINSGLSKLLWLHHHYQTPDNIHYVLNQADWISGKLIGQYGNSDHNNALKMGYDMNTHSWPQWLFALLKDNHINKDILPRVFQPGEIIATIAPHMADHLGLSRQLKICAGTTDSTAAIIATGAKSIGQAVTSLGSTLVMKIISAKPIFDRQSGVYSQPYGHLWLVGGASNSGGEVLKGYFSSEEMLLLTEELDKRLAQGNLSLLNYHYYPLKHIGERFPINNAELTPRLTPRAKNNLDFFQALLEGMAEIEAMSYKKLVELGAPHPNLVSSIGGGTTNNSWHHIREQILAVPVIKAEQQQAATGSAILAQSSW